MDDVEHVPDRPGWGCRECGKKWPCTPAREQMVKEYAGWETSLAFFMGTQYSRAQQDFFDTMTDPPYDLYARFLLWVPRPARQP